MDSVDIALTEEGKLLLKAPYSSRGCWLFGHRKISESYRDTLLGIKLHGRKPMLFYIPASTDREHRTVMLGLASGGTASVSAPSQ